MLRLRLWGLVPGSGLGLAVRIKPKGLGSSAPEARQLSTTDKGTQEKQGTIVGEGKRRRGGLLKEYLSLCMHGLSEGGVPLAQAAGVKSPLVLAMGDEMPLVQAMGGWAPLVWTKGRSGLSMMQHLLCGLQEAGTNHSSHLKNWRGGHGMPTLGVHMW